MKKLTLFMLGIALTFTIISCEEKDSVTEISIKDFKFSPATLTIKTGTTVKWTNNDSGSHTATENDQVFDSGTLATGKSFEFKFDNAGTFSYVCGFHPNMTGTITVE